MADVSDKRESDREKNALLNADYRHSRRGEKRNEEFARAFAPDVDEAFHVDHSDRDGEDDARQNAARQVLQWAGQEHEHDEHDCGEGELRDLAASARLIRHCRLGRTAIDDEGPADRRAGVGGRYTQDVRVLVNALFEDRRVCAGRRRALRDNHDEA